MNPSENRSPEKIREYFKLLEWYNGLKIPRDSSTQYILDMDERATAIRDSIEHLTNSKILLDVEFHELDKKVDSMSYELNHISSAISKNNAEITLLENRISSQQNQDVTSHRKATWTTSIKNPRRTIFSLLLNDIKRSNIFNKMYVLYTLPKVLLGYTVLLTLLLFFLKILELASSGVYQIIIFLYLLVLSVLIFTLIEFTVKYFVSKLREIENLNSSKNIRYELDENSISSYDNKTITNRKLYQALMSEQEHLQARRSKVIEEHTIGKSELGRLRVDINEVECSIHSKKIDYSERQHTIDSDLQRLVTLEKDVEIWLKNDISLITKKAMRSLNIEHENEEETNINQLNVLNRDPFSIVIGISKKEKNIINDIRKRKINNKNRSESLIIESDSDRNLESLERTDLSIDDNDFYLEEKRSSSKDIFGVYEVVIIFLCSNFLTYYKCYFNFIQNKKIDEENCEYLYDSIVSVKVQDKSRSGDNSKDTYRKRLLITTSDGKIVCFRFPRSRVERDLSDKLSGIDDAAKAIREMLRQRRIDILPTSEQG